MEYYTVGPVQMYPRTLEIAGKQIPYFRTPEFSEVVLDSERLLKDLTGATSDSRALLLTASGTAGMEAVVTNCLSKDDRVVVVDGGTFGHRFVQLCEWHGIPHDVVTLEYGEVLTLEKLEAAISRSTTALLVNMHETSTGQLYDVAMMAEVCQRRGLFFIVDAISSFLSDPLDMAELGIDALILSSQKALALAPGASMVLLSPGIIQQRVGRVRSPMMYFDFVEALKNAERGQTPYTPAVGIVYELHDMLQEIQRIGIAQKIKSIEFLATDFRHKADNAGLEMPSFPLSNALTPVIFPQHNAMEVFRRLVDEYQMYLNPTGGLMADKVLRVAHIGNHDTDGNVRLVNAIASLI